MPSLLHGKLRICWVAWRRVGKTERAANLALQLAVKQPGIQIAIFAPSFCQNVQPTEKGYEHADRGFEDVFDAVGLALSEVPAERHRGSTDRLIARRHGGVRG